MLYHSVQLNSKIFITAIKIHININNSSKLDFYLNSQKSILLWNIRLKIILSKLKTLWIIIIKETIYFKI